MSHMCQNLLIHCMDFRLQKDIKNWMEEKGILGDTDLVSVAGAGKELLSSEYRDFLLKQIRLSKELHQMKKVILMSHTDCGAYGGRAPFLGDLQKEEEKHLSDMNNMASMIKESFPDLEVKMVLLKMSDNGNIFSEI